MQQRLEQIQGRKLGRQAEAVSHIALALRQNRIVDGQHQRAEAGVARATQEIVGDFCIARGIELEPGIGRIDPRHAFDRNHAGAGHDERHVGVRGSLRQHQFGVAAKNPGNAGWRNAERTGVSAAKERGRLIAPRHVDQMARQQAVATKFFLVAKNAALVFDAAGDALIDDARQTPLGQALDIADAQCVADLHRAPPPPLKAPPASTSIRRIG